MAIWNRHGALPPVPQRPRRIGGSIRGRFTAIGCRWSWPRTCRPAAGTRELNLYHLRMIAASDRAARLARYQALDPQGQLDHHKGRTATWPMSRRFSCAESAAGARFPSRRDPAIRAGASVEMARHRNARIAPHRTTGARNEPRTPSSRSRRRNASRRSSRARSSRSTSPAAPTTACAISALRCGAIWPPAIRSRIAVGARRRRPWRRPAGGRLRGQRGSAMGCCARQRYPVTPARGTADRRRAGQRSLGH